MPKRLVSTAHDTIGWEEYELPAKLSPDRVRIRATHGAEKHGTKVNFIHGHGNRRGKWDDGKGLFVPGDVAWAWPIPLGNMQVGIVEKTGSDVEALRAGDRVLYYEAFAPTADVGQGSIFKINSETNWKTATCLDPAVYALAALRDGNVRVGDAVAVFGLGAIGLMAVQLAKLAGCHPVIAIDPFAHRREVAEKTGADLVLDPVGTDVGYKLREATGWRGVDVVIEYSGAAEALQAALRGVAYGGTVVFGGFANPMKAGLDLGAEAHMNRPNLIFSRSESEPHRDHPRSNHRRIQEMALRFILDGRLDGAPVVTPVQKFNDELAASYLKICSSPIEGIKLGVEY